MERHQFILISGICSLELSKEGQQGHISIGSKYTWIATPDNVTAYGGYDDNNSVFSGVGYRVFGVDEGENLYLSVSCVTEKPINCYTDGRNWLFHKPYSRNMECEKFLDRIREEKYSFLKQLGFEIAFYETQGKAQARQYQESSDAEKTKASKTRIDL